MTWPLLSNGLLTSDSCRRKRRRTYTVDETHVSRPVASGSCRAGSISVRHQRDYGLLN
jgi:hypothetical protein